MEMNNKKLWYVLLSILIVVGSFGVFLFNESRKFSIEAVLIDIKSIAEKERNYIEHLPIRLQQELNDKVISQSQFESDMALIKMQKKEFICIDDGTSNIFSESQKEIIEKSLLSFYAAVYWGKSSIPEKYKQPNGFFERGVIVGYAADVYPGLVRINSYGWNGFIGNGGGKKSTYVWTWSGFRPIGSDLHWVT
jgi:hypothetical protein